MNNPPNVSMIIEAKLLSTSQNKILETDLGKNSKINFQWICKIIVHVFWSILKIQWEAYCDWTSWWYVRHYYFILNWFCWVYVKGLANESNSKLVSSLLVAIKAITNKRENILYKNLKLSYLELTKGTTIQQEKCKVICCELTPWELGFPGWLWFGQKNRLECIYISHFFIFICSHCYLYKKSHQILFHSVNIVEYMYILSISISNSNLCYSRPKWLHLRFL